MTPPYEGIPPMMPRDRYKQAAESSSSGSTQGSWRPPMPQPEASKAEWAKYGGHSHPSCDQCHGECPMYQSAAAPEASEAVEALADLIHIGFEPGVVAKAFPGFRSTAERILSAGYVSPDRLASLLTEARAEALREAGDVLSEPGAVWWGDYKNLDGEWRYGASVLEPGEDVPRLGLADWLRARTPSPLRTTEGTGGETA